jgi:plasmid stabilization system protein ParE
VVMDVQVWAPLAEEQVADAFAYIASERPEAAVKWSSLCSTSVAIWTSETLSPELDRR